MNKKFFRLLVPSFKQWKSATPFEQITYIASLTAIISFLSQFFYPIPNQISNRWLEDNRTNITINKPVTYNRENITKDVISTEKVNNLRLGYNIIGIKNSQLETLIKNKSNISIDSKGQNLIHINFTGEIKKLNPNNKAYIYTGGYLFLKINDKLCHEFRGLKINEMRPTSKNLIENELNRFLNRYISENYEIISDKIIQCIGQ